MEVDVSLCVHAHPGLVDPPGLLARLGEVRLEHHADRVAEAARGGRRQLTRLDSVSGPSEQQLIEYGAANSAGGEEVDVADGSLVVPPEHGIDGR